MDRRIQVAEHQEARVKGVAASELE